MDQDIFNKSDLIYYSNLQNKTDLELRAILGEDTSKGIEKLQQWFINQIKPIELDGADSFETKYDKDFEETCFLLSKHTNKDPKLLTVREFYTIILYLKKEKK